MHLAPFDWPTTWRRTDPARRRRAPYVVSFTKAWNDLQYDMDRMDASNVRVSCLLQARQDGRPMAGQHPERLSDEPGVALYFVRGGTAQVIACDAWASVRDNLRAIGLAVAAVRSIERSGTRELMERAFSGFTALPASGSPSNVLHQPEWAWALGVPADATAQQIRLAYREKARTAHPDGGGTTEKMQALNVAYEAAMAARGEAAV